MVLINELATPRGEFLKIAAAVLPEPVEPDELLADTAEGGLISWEDVEGPAEFSRY